MNSTFKVSVILTAIDKMSKQIAGAVGNSTKYLTRFSKETSKLGDQAFNLGRQAATFGLAVGAPLYMTVRAAEDARAEVAKLEQGFKTMGDTTGKMAKKAQEFSSSLMMEIGIDDEQIMAVEGKLATFEKVIKNSKGSAEIFERSTRAAFDMEAAGFGDAMSNATQLGKALGDPLKGMQALKRSGTLMQEDIDRIGKEYKRTGNILKAQRQIMEAVEKQVQGKAAANAKATDKLKIAFGEIAEQIGGALLPEVDKFAKWLTDTLPKIQKWIDEHGDLIATGAKVAATMAGISLAVSGVSFMFGGLMKAVSFASTAFTAITTTIGLFSGGLKGALVAFKALDLAMKMNIIGVVVTALIAAGFAVKALIDAFDGLSTAEKVNAEVASKAMEATADQRMEVWKLFGILKNTNEQSQIYKDTLKRIDEISPGLTKKYDLQAGAIANITKAEKDLTDQILERAKMQARAELLKSKMLEIEKLKMEGPSIWQRVKGGLANAFIPLSADATSNYFHNKEIEDLQKQADFLANAVKKDQLKGVRKEDLRNPNELPITPKMKVPEWMGKPTPPALMKKSSLTPEPTGSGASKAVQVTFAPTFNSKGGATTKEDFQKTLKEYEPQLIKAIREAMARTDRKKFA